MECEQILKSLAPCGLNCQKCLSHVNNEIKLHINTRTKAIGIEAYFQETKDAPRYF